MCCLYSDFHREIQDRNSKMAKKMVSFCQKRYDWEQNDKNGEKNGIIFI